MTAEQITRITWEARRAYYAGLGNTDTTCWDNLPASYQQQLVESTQVNLNAIKDGGMPALPVDYPEVYRRECEITAAILTVFANAS